MLCKICGKRIKKGEDFISVSNGSNQIGTQKYDYMHTYNCTNDPKTALMFKRIKEVD
jgi:hypothetical protein